MLTARRFVDRSQAWTPSRVSGGPIHQPHDAELVSSSGLLLVLGQMVRLLTPSRRLLY
jgi:hypothetical protein